MKKMLSLCCNYVVLFGTDPDHTSHTDGSGVALKKKLLTPEENLQIKALKKVIWSAPAVRVPSLIAALNEYIQGIEV